MNTPLPSDEEDLFSQASELPVADRSAYLEKACASDTALRAAEHLRPYLLPLVAPWQPAWAKGKA